MERIRDQVKRTTTMRDVLRICGLSEPNRQGKIRSIFNPVERTPSLHVYDFDWYDFSTGQGGDQISFIQHALGVPYTRALEILGRGMSMAVRPRDRFDHDLPFEPPDFTDKYENLVESDEHAEAWRVLIPEKWPTLTLTDVWGFGCKIAENGDLWIPHKIRKPHENVRIVRGVKIRHLPDAAKSALTGSMFTVGLYRPLSGRPDKTHALLVEGESDAWVAAKMLGTRDVTVLALPSGAGTWKPRFVEELKAFKSVGVAFDDDDPGNSAWEKVQKDLESAYRIQVPGGRVAEAAADGWSI
jgi:hypothetical protein